MRKLKEVLRLHSLGLSQHQIARSCSISQSTVHEYVSAAQAAGIGWPLPEDWGDQQIEQALFPQRPAPAVWRKHPEPDWARIHEDLQKHKNLTLQLVWQEERENNPDGYGYSRFCDLYRRWLKKLDLVLRQDHRAGEKMFLDYAGATIPVHDPATGAVQQAAVFVAVLGASSYTFAEATSGQDLRNWIGSQMRAFEFFGGVTEGLVPDNLKSGVKHPSYYEPDLSPTYLPNLRGSARLAVPVGGGEKLEPIGVALVLVGLRIDFWGWQKEPESIFGARFHDVSGE